MNRSLTFARIAGIPIMVQLNWFLIAGLVTWSLAAGYYPLTYPGWETHMYWIVGAVTSLIFFASVLAHELGHGLVAIDEDVPVNSITLFIFGGVAHIAKEPDTARADFRIVVAGPFTSLVLAAAFYVLGLATAANPYWNASAMYMAYMNVVLAVFNLLPGYPLDGGRILRAAFWALTNNFRRATTWATHAGYGIALLFVAAGVFLFWASEYFSGVWIIFIGWYLGYVARQSYVQSILADPTAASNQKTVPIGKKYPVRVINRSPSPTYSSTLFLMGMGQSGKRILLPEPVRVQNCREDVIEVERAGD